MSAITVEPARRDVRVISLIGIAHGASHYYQLAFVTMLLIVRDSVGLSFEQIGALGAVFYGVSGFGQTVAGFAVDRFGARPILAGGLAALGLSLGLVSMAHSFWAFTAIAVLGGAGNSVFHPADFAILNASVKQNRLGRAFSIHGLGGSLGWAAAPVMYFLDNAMGQAGATLLGALPGLVLAVLVFAHKTDLVDHRVKARESAEAHGAVLALLSPFESGKACDDGNLSAGDCCDASCAASGRRSRSTFLTAARKAITVTLSDFLSSPSTVICGQSTSAPIPLRKMPRITTR